MIITNETTTNVLFIGYILGESYQVDYLKYDYFVRLKAVDGLDDLKYYDYRPSSTTRYIGLDSGMNIIYKCLTLAGLNTHKIVESLKTYEDDFDTTSADSTLSQVYIYQDRFYDEKLDKAWNCYDVVSEILRPFEARMQFTYYIISEWSLFIYESSTVLGESFVYRIFDAGVYDSNSTYSSLHKEIGTDIYWADEDAIEMYENLYNNVVVNFHPGLMTNLVRNADFVPSKWSGATQPYHWTKVNDPDVSRDGNKIDMAAYVSASNEYLYYKIMQPPKHSKITLNIRYNLGSAPTTEGIFNILVGLHADEAYSYNGATGGWTTHGRTNRFDLPDDWDESYNYEITIPAVYYEDDKGDVTVGYYELIIGGPRVTAGTSGCYAQVDYISISFYSESGEELIDSCIVEKEINANARRKALIPFRERQTDRQVGLMGVKRISPVYTKESNNEIDIYLGDHTSSDLQGIGIYQGAYWGGFYESDGTKTTRWKLLTSDTGAGEYGYEAIQDDLCTKIKRLYTGFSQIIEGKIRHEIDDYQNPFILKDGESDISGLERLFFPIYTELNVRDNSTTGFFREMKYFLGSELITDWTNNINAPFNTFTSDGKDITSAISLSAEYQAAYTNSFALTANQHVLLSVNLTINSGYTSIVFYLNDGIGTVSETLTDGVNTFIIVIPRAGTWTSNIHNVSQIINFEAEMSLKKIHNI